VGRLAEQKGHEGLLRAVPDIARREPNAHFVWVGNGPLESDLRERVRETRLNERVFIFPQRDDVPELMAASDLVVLPSLFEGLPLVVLEAMSAGLPVVGTRVCGTSEAISDGVTGRLVEPGDVGVLAAAVLEVLEQPELAARWGAAGRLRVEREFTADRMGRETRALYESLLRPPRTLHLDAAAHADLSGTVAPYPVTSDW
jgi:glycosyltransferase involved in cell wall biosynthesis